MGETIDASTEYDEKVPFVRNVTVLEIQGVPVVVVTDYKNKCLKSFYTKDSKSCISRLQLNYEPWDVAQLGDDKVMAPLQSGYQIVTVEVTPDLIHVDHINIRKKYSSLAVMSPSKFAAGGWDYVDILNMQGEVMKSVTTHNNMALFKFSDHMTVSNTGHLLVSDWGMDTVTCLTSEGEVVWTYSGSGAGKLIWPRGITATSGGDILVVDSELKKVLQLSASGKYVRDVLTSKDGLRMPDDVCVDRYGSAYVCECDILLKFKNLIKLL